MADSVRRTMNGHEAKRPSGESGGPGPRPPVTRSEDLPIGWTVMGNILASVLLGGGAGYGLDKLLGTDFIVGIGMVVVTALTMYYLWLRYGTH